jgi:anthranilate phosphoribosyltransferase
VHPRDIGLPTARIEDLLGGSPEHNADVLRRTLAGEQGAVRDVVLLNAAAGIVAFRLSQDPAQAQRNMIQRLTEACEEAAAAIDDGRASAKLEQWVAATQRFSAE